MSEFVYAKNVHNPDAGVVRIPVAWLETDLGKSYIVTDAAGVPCKDCDQRPQTDVVEAPVEKKYEPVTYDKKNRKSDV